MIAILSLVFPVNHALVELQIVEDVFGVRRQRGGHDFFRCRIERFRVAEKVVTPDPIDRPDGDLHGTVPVHAMIGFILLDPIFALLNEFTGVLFVMTQPVSHSEFGEVITPAQLPGNFDVRIVV